MNGQHAQWLPNEHGMMQGVLGVVCFEGEHKENIKKKIQER